MLFGFRRRLFFARIVRRRVGCCHTANIIGYPRVTDRRLFNSRRLIVIIYFYWIISIYLCTWSSYILSYRFLSPLSYNIELYYLLLNVFIILMKFAKLPLTVYYLCMFVYSIVSGQKKPLIIIVFYIIILII